jgi:hypothetical protein
MSSWVSNSVPFTHVPKLQALLFLWLLRLVRTAVCSAQETATKLGGPKLHLCAVVLGPQAAIVPCRSCDRIFGSLSPLGALSSRRLPWTKIVSKARSNVRPVSNPWQARQVWRWQSFQSRLFLQRSDIKRSAKTRFCCHTCETHSELALKAPRASKRLEQIVWRPDCSRFRTDTRRRKAA